jgi:hypothetical protein
MLSVLLVATGCGDESSAPNEAGNSGDRAVQVQAVRAVVDEANSSFADGDYEQTCRQYTERGQRLIIESVSATSCVDAWHAIASAMRTSMTPEQIKATTEYGVEAVRINGDTATARYGEPPAAIRDLGIATGGEEIELRRTGGVWRINSLPPS